MEHRAVGVGDEAAKYDGVVVGTGCGECLDGGPGDPEIG
jgi:hypothetical protein